jgi:lipoprotein-anchoring transpeptidase ErfK/SrfK
VETSNMLLRTAAGLIVLACTLGSTIGASAQTYRSQTYPGATPPPNYQSPPLFDDEADEPAYLPPPGAYDSRGRADAPYPYDPARRQTGIEQQSLPPPAAGTVGTYPRPGYPGEPQPLYAPRNIQPEPYAIPQDRRVVAQPPVPDGGFGQPLRPSPAYNDGYAVAPMRPPADVATSERGPILDLNRPSSMLQGQPPGPAAPPPVAAPNGGPSVATLPPDYEPETGERKELPPHLRRQLVDYPSREPAGSIVIDTPNTYLYLMLGNGKAMRYGIGVGREGFTWSGVERVTRMAEWPDWHPPTEMIERQPYLPRFMAGGESNPLGARALYLGKTVYRIHGTNQPSTIGSFVSSGCIRLVNEDVTDLYSRVQVGTRVVVLPGRPPASASAAR